MDGLVSRASMIRLSLHPLPASETSAFNKIHAFSTRRAGLFPFRISVSSRSRSSPVSLTTYFFTEISFAAMIASLASRWRRKRITKSFQSRNVQFDERLTTDNMDLVRAAAANLVDLNSDVIVSAGDRVIPILTQLTRSIPPPPPSKATECRDGRT